ncbi:hypothetical protein SPRG_00073 [Saprolegnia parasitica CBS 223.65]|uniref:EF-hand domain-containing protein n=1 Tax=Saprolegnia parasitica (strain CBS 223.65) TaxID=695850 RepID=A0A067CXM8_SAPPC|nr:hypothetical protein SPRG_00073 [Saprolegnia parasitica CBS 223.65]KDO35228.1 hypothetical protein SPRG_00073 [Saprolegnia parasitica CBS 223.65]|eukprot:XP_012193579.1 hypothetical protein SPRG_00073 [Saprolegnia parasitica CBS 223.65]
MEGTRVPAPPVRANTTRFTPARRQIRSSSTLGGPSFITEVEVSSIHNEWRQEVADGTSDNDDDDSEADRALEREFRSHALTPFYKADPEKGFTMDIMMLIDMAKVGSLRDEFQQKESGLSVTEFVTVMLRFVRSSKQQSGDNKSHLHDLTEPQLIAYLSELFAQIDINGDGTMEWEEFTSFIVDTGLESQQPNSIQMYHHSSWEDTSKHSSGIDRMYYFPTNDRLALCEYGGHSLKIYNSRCELLKALKSPDGFVLCAEYVDKLSQYVVASSDLQLRFYDDTSYRLIKSCHTPTSQNCLRWYPQANVLFSGSASGIIYAWDADRMEERHHMGGIGRDGKLLTRSHDGIVLDLLNLETLETLASASMDKSIRLWDVNTGKHKQQLDGHMKGVRALAYSSEYRFLVSAGFDFDALVWNPYVDQLILRLHGHQNSLCGVEIVPDTPQIITADIDGVFKVWDIRNFACMQTFTAENVSLGEIKTFASVTSQKRIVAGGKRMTAFDYEKLRNPKLTDDFPVFVVLYNPVSLSLITAAGTDIKIWDANLGKLLRVYRNVSTTDVTSLCLDSQCRKFIVGDHEGNVRVFDYLNGALMKAFAYPETNDRAHLGEVARLVYCNAYRSVISASWDTTVCIHDESDPERGVLLRKMTGGHTGDITSLAYSHTLSLIATGSLDCMVQIWDYEFGRLDGTCIGHTSGISSLLFLDPYPLLAVCDLHGNVCLWAMRPSKYKYRCVLRFRVQTTLSLTKRHGASHLPVMTTHVHTKPLTRRQKAIGFVPSSAILDYFLIGGDDKGVLSVWNLYPLLHKLEADFGIRAMDKAVECVNPGRNLRIHAAELVRKTKDTPEWLSYAARDPQTTFHFSRESQMPLLRLQQLEAVHQWRAHDDVIYSIQVVLDHSTVTLVSSSFDRMVKLWRLDGESLGALTQGDMELGKQPYKFPIDYQHREFEKLVHAKTVIKQVRKTKKEDESRDPVRVLRPKAPPPPAIESMREYLDGPPGSDASGSLPPLHLKSASATWTKLRKTPRIKPVSARGAGRSIRGKRADNTRKES